MRFFWIFISCVILIQIIRWVKRAAAETSERSMNAPASGPAVGRAPPASHAPPAAPPPPNPRGPWFGRTALVVEDSATIQRLVAMVLAPEGLALGQAFDLDGARRQLAEREPDLLIVDHDLWRGGGGSGAGIATWLELGATPVIVLAHDRSDAEARAVAPVRAVIGKPFESAELLAAVEQIVPQASSNPACPVCGDPDGDLKVRCPACGRAHHEACWTLNGGCGQCNPSP